MQNRYLTAALEKLCFADHKIALVSGPRQCGKTTMAQRMLSQRKAGWYYNWDQTEFRKQWAQHPGQLVPARKAGRVVPLLIFDEIHKSKRWKRTLKGIYDTLDYPVDIFVTGSAHLTVYRKGSDSLLGRYLPFRLHPFSLREMAGLAPASPDDALQAMFSTAKRNSTRRNKYLEQLLRFGPFPEPLFRQDERKLRLWQQTRVDALVREDLRDLSRISELSKVQLLVAMLPDRVASPLSLNALREDLEVSHDTVRRWLDWLKELFYVFEIKPYARRIHRSIKKEGKAYLWDYSEIRNPGARFENLVACHLLKACHYWTDTGEGKFTLCYLRNKDGVETDFLIVKDGEPWLPIETKLSDTTASSALAKYMRALRCSKGLQLMATSSVCDLQHVRDEQILVCNAADALIELV